jgi:hypothetical protein
VEVLDICLEFATILAETVAHATTEDASVLTEISPAVPPKLVQPIWPKSYKIAMSPSAILRTMSFWETENVLGRMSLAEFHAKPVREQGSGWSMS